MVLNLDTIKFEQRSEVQNILIELDKYFDMCPKAKNNKELMDLYKLLDALDMSW